LAGSEKRLTEGEVRSHPDLNESVGRTKYAGGEAMEGKLRRT